MLQLALANKRIHRIAIQHLYENVTMHQDDYRPSSTFAHFTNSTTIIQDDYTTPHSNVLRLANMIRSNTLQQCHVVTRLTITISILGACNRVQTSLSLLLPQLSSLKDLSLEFVSDNEAPWQHEQFSLAAFGVALNHTCETLRSLSMHLFLDPKHSDGWTIGSLRHFSKLTYLSIQGNVLLGPYGSSAVRMPSLDSVLPPQLKYLRLHWCVIAGFPTLRVVLANFVKDSLRAPRKTERVAVELNDKATDQMYQSDMDVFERGVANMNEEARQGGLDLRIALEWRKDCQPVVLTFGEQYDRFIQS